MSLNLIKRILSINFIINFINLSTEKQAKQTYFFLSYLQIYISLFFYLIFFYCLLFVKNFDIQSKDML